MIPSRRLADGLVRVQFSFTLESQREVDVHLSFRFVCMLL